jgi:hypothetical protein
LGKKKGNKMFYAKQTAVLNNGYTESLIVALDSKKDREVFIAAKPSFTAITSKEKIKLCFNRKFLGNPVYEKSIDLHVRYIVFSINETKTKEGV